MSLIKDIALEHDDVELFKLACELEKDGATNPMQMAIQRGMAEKNPMQGLQYDRVTSAAAAAKADPSKLPQLRDRLIAFKKTGPVRIDDAAKAGIKAGLHAPAPLAKVAPLATGLANKLKPLNLLSKVK